MDKPIKSITPKFIKVELPEKKLSDYEEICPEVIADIKLLAQELSPLKIINVNATSFGGGVSVILKSLVPLLNDAGIDTTWYVIPPNDEFFEVTKTIHNHLQGKKGELSEKQRKTYLDYSKLLADLMDKEEADVIVFHDPQTLAMPHYMKQKNAYSIWRCHIDTSAPNKNTWDFLKPHFKNFDHYIFTMADFTNEDLEPEKISLITPVIDPLSEENKIIPKHEALSYLKQYGIDVTKPVITQVSRFDPWKDPLGVIDAYMLAKKKFPDLQLVFLSQLATDDPEGVRLYEEVRDYAENKPDITIILNPPENGKLLNALQTGSTIILQKSIKEGFGMTVTEAMWKSNVVIAGNTGGIKLQIEDGVNGFLTNSIEETAEKIIYALEHPGVIERIKEEAHLSVKSRYLTPHLIHNYLELIKKNYKKQL